MPWQHSLNESLGLTASASGRYLLMYGWNNRVQRSDVVNDQMVTLPALWRDNLLTDVAW